MKQYGANKTTDFTKKQINVIWAKAKNRELNVEEWFIKRMYNLAEYYGYDDNRSVESDEVSVKQILNAVFGNDIQEAQRLIDLTQDAWFKSYTSKYQAKIDRNIFVK